MLLHVHKEKTDKLDLLQIAKKFVSINDRRKKLFGSTGRIMEFHARGLVVEMNIKFGLSSSCTEI